MFSVTAKLPYNTADTTHNMTDRILEMLFKHLQQHLPPGTKVVADLAGQLYTLPTSLLTDLRPDSVLGGQRHECKTQEGEQIPAPAGAGTPCGNISHPSYPRFRPDAEASLTARASTTSLPWHQPILKYRSH